MRWKCLSNQQPAAQQPIRVVVARQAHRCPPGTLHRTRPTVFLCVGIEPTLRWFCPACGRTYAAYCRIQCEDARNHLFRFLGGRARTQAHARRLGFCDYRQRVLPQAFVTMRFFCRRYYGQRIKSRFFPFWAPESFLMRWKCLSNQQPAAQQPIRVVVARQAHRRPLHQGRPIGRARLSFCA